MKEVERYYLDHYGKCNASKCLCARQGWLGFDCPNWISMGAKNPDELGIAQKRFKETHKE